MKYASLIVTYNRKQKLIKAIKSLLDQTYKPSLIILIDNCSNDGTQALLKEKGYLDNELIHYVRLHQNYGGSGGFYYGAKEAVKLSSQFEYLSFSDDDAYFKPDYFAIMQNIVRDHHDIMAFCGTVKNTSGLIQTIHRRRIVNRRTIKEEAIAVPEYEHNFYVDTFSFVGSFLKMDVIKKIGLPHKDYFIYFDDTEYSLRVSQYTKILNVSKAVVVHDTVARRNNVSPINWKSYYDLRNSMLMKKEHSNWQFLNLYFIGHLLKASLIALTSPQFSGIRKRAVYTYFKAYQDAMKGNSGKSNTFLPGHPLPY